MYYRYKNKSTEGGHATSFPSFMYTAVIAFERYIVILNYFSKVMSFNYIDLLVRKMVLIILNFQIHLHGPMRPFYF